MADIKNIDVFQTVTSVSFEVEPNTNIININKVTTSGYTGVPNLQDVTDEGANTTNGISIDTEDTYEIGLYAISSDIGIKGESREAYGVYGTSPTVGVYGNSDNGYGVQGNSDNGVAVYGSSQDQIGVQGNSYSGTAISAYSEYGTGLYAASESGAGMSVASNSIGLEVNGNGTIAIEANLGNSNKGLVINSGTSSTGNFIELDKNGVDKLVVNQAGELTATKLIKQGGSPTEFLMADGSVSTGGGGGSQDLQSVTDIGATTTNTITANSITTTIDSTINGVRVGRGNISGTVSENTAVGYQALQSVIHTTGSTGYYNSAFGDKALKSLTTGYANDAFGDAALNLCTTGTFNLAIGTAAMLNSTTATQNTAVGQYALQNNISGQKNTAIGLSALGQNTASYNTAIGSYAGGGVSSTGTENILIGYQAGSSISSGRNNLLIENQSGGSIGTGSYNIILNPKQRSGVTTGSNNTIIGCFDNTFATGLTSNVIIGNGLGAIRFQSTDTGLTTVPAQTNTLINGDATGKAVVTKEYLSNIQTGFVPYTGATSDVNLGEFGIQLGNLEFDNTPTNIPTAAGSVYYNDADGTLDLILKGGNVTLQLGQETVIRVVNKTATNISLLQGNYQAVRITGAQGQRPKVDLAQATNDVLSAETIGLVTETIANNQEGFITTSGLVRGINTTGSLQGETWLDGDVLYLSPTVAGGITKVKPIAPNHLIIIGYVISAHVTQGTIFVKVDNGYELNELHNVKINGVANNNVLAYTSSTSIWENKTIETALGYTPYNATNPSGYQTASQVQTIADAKVANTITNGVTTSAPNQDVVFDALASKQDTLQNTVNIKSINGNSILGSGDLTISGTGISSLNGLTGATQTFSITTNTGTGIPAWTSSGTNHQLNIPIAGGASTGLITGTSQSISGSKTFLSNPEIPVPAVNTATCIVLGTAGGGGATGTLQIGSTDFYPTALEMQYVKGVTSSVQTQLNGKQPTLTAGNGIDITTNTISTVDTSRAAYTMLANNTNASSVPTTQVYKDIAEQTYSGSPTWSGTAPTTILANTYKWNQVGSLVTIRLSLSYNVGGSNATVFIPLPTDLPTPSSPTGFTGALDILYYGTGTFNTSTQAVAVTPRTVLLRRNTANNGYEFLLTTGTAISIKVVHLTLQYFT